MRTRIFTLLCTAFAAIQAQEEFPVAWKTRFPFHPGELSGPSTSGSVFIGSSSGEILALSGDVGTQRWGYKFKDRFKTNFKLHFWNKELGLILLANKSSKSSVVAIDENTGMQVWEVRGVDYERETYSLANALKTCYRNADSSQFLLSGSAIMLMNLSTGNTKWTSRPFITEKDKLIYLLPIGQTLAVSHGPDPYQIRTDIINALTGDIVDSLQGLLQNQIMFPELVVIGEKKAELSLSYPDELNSDGRTRLVTLQAADVESRKTLWRKRFDLAMFFLPVSRRPLLEVEISPPYIIVAAQSLNIFELSSGKLLWSVKYKHADAKKSFLMHKVSVFKDVSRFEVYNNAVFVSDIEDGDIRKYDLATGKLLWQTSKLGSDLVVPFMEVRDNELILQTGGRLEFEAVAETQGGPIGVGLQLGAVSLFLHLPPRTFTYRESEFVGDVHSVFALDLKTGSQLWRLPLPEKARVANLLCHDGSIILGERGQVKRIHPSDGSILSQSDLSQMQLGELIKLEKDSVSGLLVLDLDKGIAFADPANLKIVHAISTGKNFGHFWRGEFLFVRSSGSFLEPRDFVRIDVKNGRISGRYPASKVTDQIDDFMSVDGRRIFTRSFQRIECHRVD